MRHKKLNPVLSAIFLDRVLYLWTFGGMAFKHAKDMGEHEAWAYLWAQGNRPW